MNARELYQLYENETITGKIEHSRRVLIAKEISDLMSDMSDSDFNQMCFFVATIISRGSDCDDVEDAREKLSRLMTPIVDLDAAEDIKYSHLYTI